MVLTLEPGIYLADRGFGVRVEDVVLVTQDGARILSDALPREAEAVEKWMTGSGAPSSVDSVRTPH
jgi:Xaa-Pro aminopeptidase